MTAKLLDGKLTAKAIKQELKAQVQTLKASGVEVSLATVLVGNDPASQTYVNGKHRDCAEVGIDSIRLEFDEDITQAQLLAEIDRLNKDSACTAYIVQLPLPKHIDTNAVLYAIDPAKDADGLHPVNLGKSVLSVTGEIDFPISCTPNGIIELIKRHGISMSGKNICVVGRGITVGRCLPALLTRKDINATVTVVHTGTPDMSVYTRQADIVIVATGYKHLLKATDIKAGAVLLDVGVTREYDEQKNKYVIYGDIDPSCYEIASYYSPNPGGVGPMTRAMLLSNVVNIAKGRI